MHRTIVICHESCVIWLNMSRCWVRLPSRGECFTNCTRWRRCQGSSEKGQRDLLPFSPFNQGNIVVIPLICPHEAPMKRNCVAGMECPDKYCFENVWEYYQATLWGRNTMGRVSSHAGLGKREQNVFARLRSPRDMHVQPRWNKIFGARSSSLGF